MRFLLGSGLFWTLLFTAPLAYADEPFARMEPHPEAPHCLVGDEVQPINTETVLQWKFSTANQFVARGNVWGIIEGNPMQRNDHTHFIVRIGMGDKDLIEVVYNREFGELPQALDGLEVQACGDYITANKRAGHYPPSPAGAILHWVHEAVGSRHESGFLMIDGKLYGYDTSAANIKKKYSPHESTSWSYHFGF